jgi:parvulin-like peptidyl-prolyl isomerase
MERSPARHTCALRLTGMDMRLLRFLPIALICALVLVAAGCGGGGSTSVPSNAVAKVGSDTITKAQYNFLLDGAKRSYKARKASFPKPGTSSYKQLSDQAMAYLVQQDELEQKAKGYSITVTDADVAKRLKQLKQQYFQGNEKAYKAQLKQQGLTEEALKQDLHAQILSERLYAKVTGKLKVTDAAIKQYYEANKAQYGTAASRDVRHILVNNKALADKLESQLKSGGDFASLAKKYSKDPGSAKLGGKLTITKGQTVAEFDKEAFALKTNEISPPVHTQYGWHIIQALSPVKPATTTPLSKVKTQIQQQLLQTKKTDVMTKWLNGVKKDFAKQVHYQVGYAPASTATTETAGTTTG